MIYFCLTNQAFQKRMNKVGLLLLTATLFVTQQACNNNQRAATGSIDSTANNTATQTPTEITLTERLTGLGLTTDSDWRGINLGDDFSKVKATEKGEPFESDATHTGYTVEFENLETADILYYQTNQKISGIAVDLYLNSRPSVTGYQRELGTYFTARYGVGKPGAGGTVWNGPKGQTVTLKDVSKGKDFGLKIKIGSVAGQATASAKTN